MAIDQIKEVVKSRYDKLAESGGPQESCCCPSEEALCSGYAVEHGLYGQEELSLIPQTALNLSRGCGNPTGFANLQPGEVVVDLGCGGGIDVILAAQKVGSGGKVVGVDFAPQMIEWAKEAVAEAGLGKRMIEFYLTDMEKLELPDHFADVVISNCVINLCPDKEAVYREASRILKADGRLAISDIVTTKKIPSRVREHLKSVWVGCLGGAMEENEYLRTVRKAGFGQVEIVARHNLNSEELEGMARCPGKEFTPAPQEEDLAAVQGKVASLKFTATK